MKQNYRIHRAVLSSLAFILSAPIVVYGAYEVISRAYTVTNMLGGPPLFSEAVSCAYTVTNHLSYPPIFGEAVSPAYTIASSDPVAPGDLNYDGWVDIYDYLAFGRCMRGPNGGLLAGCSLADLHRDADVDLQDFSLFEVLFGN